MRACVRSTAHHCRERMPVHFPVGLFRSCPPACRPLTYLFTDVVTGDRERRGEGGGGGTDVHRGWEIGEDGNVCVREREGGARVCVCVCV